MTYLILSLVVLVILVLAGKWYEKWKERRLERLYREDVEFWKDVTNS